MICTFSIKAPGLKLIFGLTALLFLSVPASASAIGGSVHSLRYTCTLRDGSIAATNVPEVAEDPGRSKSALFQKIESNHPASIRVSEVSSKPRAWSEITFRSEILERLRPHIAGMHAGESKRVEISSTVSDGMPEAERFIKIARVQTREKTMRIPVDQFRRKTRQEPLVGLRTEPEEGFSTEVTDFDGAEVMLRIIAPSGAKVKTPYGVAAIRDAGENFELDIDARPGSLVKAGPLAGRISHVDQTWITLDFGHPFGGESLVCDVTAESVQESPEPSAKGNAAVDPQAVRRGDGVRVNFTARTSAGEPIAASRREAAESSKLKGHRSFAGQAVDGLVSLIAGEASEIPGLATEIIGMKPGENKRVQVPAERAYGPLRSSDVTVFPAVRRLPRVMAMGPAEYMKNFQSDPQLEAEVALTPYFNGRVVAFENENPVIAALPEEGRISEKFGTVDIRLAGDEVVMRMAAKVGAEFELNGRTGRITQADSEQFTVDFNHPLAGREIVLEIEVVSLIKAERLREEPLPWIEDHEAGLAEGARRKKPVVLVLHAEWCDGCKKLSAESLQDGRIKIFKDDFVWVKVDSDKQPLMAELYEQKSFPTIVILGTQGKVVKKIEGYRDAAALRRELESVR